MTRKVDLFIFIYFYLTIYTFIYLFSFFFEGGRVTKIWAQILETDIKISPNTNIPLTS